MGSPLRVLFANFFMGNIEEEVFDGVQKLQIDDIFLKAENNDQIVALQQRLVQASGLNFTIENILDVLVKQGEGSFHTSVYTKSSNSGHCLYGLGECPQRYKISTISAYVRRSLSHCSSWKNT